MSAVLAALAIGLGPTIAIIATYVLNKRDSRTAARKVATQVEGVRETVASTADANEGKLDEIHVLVNSRLTEVLARLNAALDRVDELEARLGLPPTREEI